MVHVALQDVSKNTNTLQAELNYALEHPVDANQLSNSTMPGDRVVIIVSDATRDEPRAEMVQAVMDRLPIGCRITIAIANGTHQPQPIDRLGLRPSQLRSATIVNHDSRDRDSLVSLGDTTRGTPIFVHRCVVESDLVVATGRIKPHYFAGYGAGSKAIFPGLGGETEIRINHRLKRLETARPGVINNNPCRLDLEEAVDLLNTKTFLLNVIFDNYATVHAAVAGNIRTAFRHGAAMCAALFRVRVPSVPILIVSDKLPLTASLYQASKLVAAVAPAVPENGTIIVAAQCPEGTGPIETVNRDIYELGLMTRLPKQHRVVLVSELSKQIVDSTYCQWAPSVRAAVDAVQGDVAVVPFAGCALVEAI